MRGAWLRERNALIPAAILAFGVVAWEHLVHLSFGLPRSEELALPHLTRDAVLAFPLTFLAVRAARFVASRPVTQALAASVVLSVLLVPSVGVHGVIDGHEAHLVGLEAATSPWGVQAHGLRDSALGFIVALPLAFFALSRRGGVSPRRIRPALVMCMASLLMVASLGPAVPPANALARFSVEMIPPPVLRPAPDGSININMEPACPDIIPTGPCTNMWTFNGTFPGPTLRLPSGQTTTVNFANNLNLPVDGNITIHNHGNHSASSEDGQPNDYLIPQGGSRTYTYDGMEGGKPERAAFQWYHDHRMDLTCRNVWMGLAGMLILDPAPSDPEKAVYDQLPNGDYDVPLMIADREFDANNQLVDKCASASSGVLAHAPLGLGHALGSTVLVNGRPQPFFKVADRKYRFRILNSSPFALWNLSLDSGQDMIQVATESGLLPKPVRRQTVLLGPAERAEVVIDFSGMLGKNIVLRSVGRLFAPDGRLIAPDAIPGQGSRTDDIMQFQVTSHVPDDSVVPETLSPGPSFPIVPVSKVWEFGPGPDPESGRSVWTINGMPFDPNKPQETVTRGVPVRWVLVNEPAGFIISHLVHIHEVDWREVSRNGRDPPAWEQGLKETFLLDPGEVVVVESVFTDNTGPFLIHCHILGHEDHSMMARFDVVP